MNVAASVRRSKERYPEHYCSNPRCLWRVYDARTDAYTPCGNHPSLPVGKDRHTIAGEYLRAELRARLLEAQLRELRELADARLDLLREHYGYDRDGIPRGPIAPCSDPDRYLRDCGRCLRCRSIYRDGALVGKRAGARLV